MEYESSQVKLLIPIMRFAFVQRANSKSQKYKSPVFGSTAKTVVSSIGRRKTIPPPPDSPPPSKVSSSAKPWSSRKPPPPPPFSSQSQFPTHKLSASFCNMNPQITEKIAPPVPGEHVDAFDRTKAHGIQNSPTSVASLNNCDGECDCSSISSVLFGEDRDSAMDIIAPPLKSELCADPRVQCGTVCDEQFGSMVEYDLDFSSSWLNLPQSTFSLVALNLAAHEQKSATHDVTANLFYPSSSSFETSFAHVITLPLLTAAASVSPTCLECQESGPSKKWSDQMPKDLWPRKAKAKQKAETDITYCALPFKANRHRKATAKLKKNVEVSLVPPSQQHGPRMIRKLN